MISNNAAKNRINNILIKDKMQNPQQILPILKSDISSILRNYLQLEKIDLQLFFKDNSYTLNISAKCNRIKNINFFK